MATSVGVTVLNYCDKRQGTTKHCCYGICNSDSRYRQKDYMDDVYFIPFPKPKRNELKCKKWIAACGRENFTVDKVKRWTYICSKHFVGGQGPTSEHPDPIPATYTPFQGSKLSRKRKAPSPRMTQLSERNLLEASEALLELRNTTEMNKSSEMQQKQTSTSRNDDHFTGTSAKLFLQEKKPTVFEKSIEQIGTGKRMASTVPTVPAISHILLLEPFNGGSHKQLVDLLCKEIPQVVPVTLPGKKWHWKARVSALPMSQVIPHSDKYRILFASSVLNLCELVSLRPDLSSLKKILYFHENQLVYPKQAVRDRDYQYGYNNITSCLVADVVLFNSRYNRDSFLRSVDSYLNKIPYEKPKGIADQIRGKCHVLNFPICFPSVDDIKDSLKGSDNVPEGEHSSTNENSKCLENHTEENARKRLEENASQTEVAGGNQSESLSAEMDVGNHPPGKRKPLHIVWPHRWEHDKNPDMMFRVMDMLMDAGCDFRLSVLGEQYLEYPKVFHEHKDRLEGKLAHWGYQESKLKYYQILYEADCVISTADHEFFGVAMLEAVHLGCFPLCPNRLVYPEIFPKECLYNTETQLYKRLREFCRKPYTLRRGTFKFNTEQYSWETLKPQFTEYLMVDESNT